MFKVLLNSGHAGTFETQELAQEWIDLIEKKQKPWGHKKYRWVLE